ncbi:MAG TPA: cation:proton antiporter [Patescibacteria group bacterium]|nr:cation:proton antiporter [Patescibacteria group bacterium]
MDIILGIFLVVAAAVFGGAFAKLLKLPVLVGYIIAGILFGTILPGSAKNVATLAQIGTILLLFSIGVELPITQLSKFLKLAVFGSLIQILLVTGVSFVFLNSFGFSQIVSLILSLGFSISSTAVLVLILGDRGEMDTIHGGIMFSWSLVQDLLVIPIMIILPILGTTGWGAVGLVGVSLLKSIIIIFVAFVLGKLVVPYTLRLVTALNSRELLLLSSVAIAMGTAALSSYFGISPAIGAFLAGVVISESQEHHAIFAETRPLRDLFVALFFVTLGFLVNPAVILGKLPLIIIVTLAILIIKAVIVFVITTAFGYKGRTAIATSFGLAQVGEFAFVIFSTALTLNFLTPSDFSVGIAVTLLTLVVSPILFTWVVPFWRKMREITSNSGFAKLFAMGEKRDMVTENLTNHIIICGYGRVGGWVGKGLTSFGIPYIVVDYNQKVVQDLKNEGTPVLYGDPTEPEVLEAVSIRGAKAVILAIPDRVAQETLIAYVQTVAPETKIISRVHQDSDWEKLKTLRVDKIVQPEFEAAIEIIKSILKSIGKNKEEIAGSVKSLRVSHSQVRI